MGWFRNRRERKRSAENVIGNDGTVNDVLLRALLANEPIDRDKAMMLPAVSGAVDIITSAVACMPVRLYRTKKGSVEEVENDPRTKMLNGDTGDTLDGFQLKKAMVEDYLMGKGGYCYIERSRNDVTGLYYVKCDEVSININSDPIHKSYDIIVGDGTYKPFEFIKILRNTKDGASGVGLTVEVAKALETGYQTLMYQLGLVKAGGNKRGFLKSQRKLGQEEIDTLKSAWSKLYANSEENVVVSNNGLEFQEASSTSTEMQLNENKRTMADEINGIFHIKENFEETWKFAIYPIVRAFETALNRDLLLEREKRNYFFAFDSREIIKASFKERYETYQLAKECGIMTINEMRRNENMNEVQGLDIIDLGLGSVLFDTATGETYTPNTDSTKAAGVSDSKAQFRLKGVKQMQINIREDAVEIVGYVNAVERNSKPLLSRMEKFIERIKAGAFARALKRNDDVHVLLNHDWQRDLGSTKKGNLELTEDNIGLRAKCTISDKEVMEMAKRGDLVGWSFGFYDRDVTNGVENGILTREVNDLDLEKVSILDRSKVPAYDGTLIMARNEDSENDMFLSESFDADGEPPETRYAEPQQETKLETKQEIDYSKYKAMIAEMKEG